MVAVGVALVCALGAAPAVAHPRESGLLQARLTEDGVEVLLKLDTRMLFDAVALGAPEAFDPLRLAEPTGRGRVMHLIAERVKITAATGLCERDSVDLFQLTPSQRHLDVIMTYHCAHPRQFVELTTTILLDDTGHFLSATFADQAGGVTHKRLKRSGQTFRFEVPNAPPPPAPELPPPPPRPSPTGTPAWGLVLGLLVAALTWGRGRAPKAIGLAAASVVAASVGAGLALAWPPLTEAMAGPWEPAMHLVTAATLAAAGAVFGLRERGGGWAHLAWLVPGAVVAGAVVGGLASSAPAVWWVFGAGVAVAAGVGVAVGESSRWRTLSAVEAVAVASVLALDGLLAWALG